MPRRDFFVDLLVVGGSADQTAPNAGSALPGPVAHQPADVGWDAVPRTAAVPADLRPTSF